MPRNGSGVYNLPQPAFTPNTTISSAAVNSDLSDIASALTQSVSADGQTTLTGALKNQSGTVTAPGITFASGTSTGFFLAGTNQIGIATAGAQVGLFNNDQSITWTGGTTFNGNVTFNSGTWTFSGGSLTAFYTAVAPKSDVAQVIDGQGNVITTGQRGQLHIPFPMTINTWSIMADQSGSITIDVLRANNAVPVSSIVGGGTAPNLSSAQYTQAAPNSWTATTLATNDWIVFNVTAATTVQRVNITLTCTRTGS